jgi:hypothetical protein
MTRRWTPSIVPNGDDQNVYLVVDDFGRNGRAYREADVETTNLQTVIVDLLAVRLGRIHGPARGPIPRRAATAPVRLV